VTASGRARPHSRKRDQGASASGTTWVLHVRDPDDGSGKLDFACAKRSWRDPTGGSPVQVTGSTGLVASVALWKATTTAKRTQQSCGVCMEPRNQLIAGAETVQSVERNMSDAVMRGIVALPGSETTSRTKGSRRNLGDLQPPAAATAVPGRFGKARSRSRTGRLEESDGCIVPMKPRTTPADRLVAESVEGRRPVEGRARANACPGHRAGIRMSPTA
jgi:hypothetical protein